MDIAIRENETLYVSVYMYIFTFGEYLPQVVHAFGYPPRPQSVSVVMTYIYIYV